MATVHVRSKNRQARRHAVKPSAGPQRTSRWGTRRRLAVVALFALLAVIWFAPTLIAKTGLLNLVVSRTVDLNGSLRIGSASLGWLSPIRLEQVEVRDADGETVIAVGSLGGDTALWRLLASPNSLGRIRLDEPHLNLLVDDHSSNLEAVFAAYLADEDETGDEDDEQASTAGGIAVQLEIIGGSVELRCPDSQRMWRLTSLAALAVSAADGSQPLHLTASGEVPDGATVGRFNIDVEIKNPLASDPAGTQSMDDVSGKLAVATEKFPLEAAEAILARFAPGVRLTGEFTSRVDCHWNETDGPNAEKLQLAADLSVAGLRMSAPWLKTDTLELAELKAPCRVVWQGDQLHVHQAAVVCDLGNATFQGTLDTTAGLIASLTSQTYQVKGQVDLERLAATLPATIRLRDDTRITAGQLNFELASARNDANLSWQGQLETSNLVAVSQGLEHTWEAPIRMALEAHQDGDTKIVDRLLCDSSFLQMTASGTADRFDAQASCNLDRLSEELRQFVDLGEAQMAGEGRARFGWNHLPDGRFESGGECQLTKLRLAFVDAPAWNEERLVAHCQARGALTREDWELIRIDSASIDVNTADDQLLASLTQPVEYADAKAVWPVEVRCRGELAKWQPRLAPWLGLPEDWRTAGNCQLTAAVSYSSQIIDVAQVQLHVDNLAAQVAGLRINEPAAELMVRGNWEQESGQVNLVALSAKAESLSCEANNLVWRPLEDGKSAMAGAVVYRGDLARLMNWLENPEEPSTYHLTGQIAGSIELGHHDQSTSGTFMTRVSNLVAQFEDGQTYRDPEAKLIGQVTYNAGADQIQIERCEIAATGLNANAAGHIADWSKRCELELTGQVAYDLERLEPLVRMQIGNGVTVRGRETRKFAVHGPLAAGNVEVALHTAETSSPADAEHPPRSVVEMLSAQASLGWQWADAYGFRMGKGDLQANVRDGLLQIAPMDVVVSGGRLKAAPVVRLAPGPMELFMPRGPLVEQVQITPQMCAGALQYIAPVLAGVTEAQGTFSIDLDGGRVPLDDPKQADVAGRLVVHSVQIGPGPLTQELAVLMNRPSPARLARESAVTFRMVDRRVYHRDLELVFPDFTIRTHGSVGMDGTVAIMAELPVPPKWIGNNALGDALKNRTLRLPIGGTMERPKIDQQVLAQLTAEFATEGAVDALKGELNRQLNKLFRDR